MYILYHFYTYYLPHLMLHGYFISVILQILDQEEIRRKTKKIGKLIGNTK